MENWNNSPFCFCYHFFVGKQKRNIHRFHFCFVYSMFGVHNVHSIFQSILYGIVTLFALGLRLHLQYKYKNYYEEIFWKYTVTGGWWLGRLKYSTHISKIYWNTTEYWILNKHEIWKMLSIIGGEMKIKRTLFVLGVYVIDFRTNNNCIENKHHPFTALTWHQCGIIVHSNVERKKTKK